MTLPAFHSKSLLFIACFFACAYVYSRQNILFSDQLFMRVEKEHGIDARNRIESWQKLLFDRLPKAGSAKNKLKMTNDFFNAVPWRSDEDHWGQEDYWSTPIELLATNAGDCEDYSVAKYYSLRHVSVADKKLRITYVKSITYNQAHMVLAYYPYPNADPLILDNINKTILPASQRKDLVPVYSFNGDSIFLAQQNQKRLSKTSESGLPKWKKLNERFFRQLKGL